MVQHGDDPRGPHGVGERRGNDGWPPITWEARPWESQRELPASRTQRRLHRGDYQAAVVPSIAAAPLPAIDGGLIAELDDASQAIARFDATWAESIAPYSTLLLRSESAASSQIEQLTASARSIAIAELGDPTPRNGSIIVANTRAMQAAIELADSLDEAAIIETHRVLLERTQPDAVGGWRTSQVWIGGRAIGPHTADFVPPHHDRVEAAMRDLVAFLHRTDVPVLLHAAIAHAQFETIHPFPDGNGRTGRALLHAVLRSGGLTRGVTIPVSAGLLHDVSGYFRSLDAYRAGALEPLLSLVVDASFRAIDNASRLVDDLDALRARWRTTVEARSDSVAWRIIEFAIERPVFDSPLARAHLGVATANLLRGVEILERAGVLTEITGNARNRRWAALDVLELLDEFAARAGRRRTPR